MLVLSRKPGERIMIGDDIILEVIEDRRRGREPKLRIGITAPKTVPIYREEVYLALHGPPPEKAAS